MAALVGSYAAYRTFAASASLSLLPATNNVNLGSEFNVTVRVNSGTDPINAVQADLTYPVDKLQFVSIDDSGSAFGVEAESSGGNGSVKIARGTSGGTSVTGDQLVAVVKFKAIGLGSAGVTFASTSAVVTSTNNTNILTVTNGATYAIVDTTPPSVPTGLTAPTRTVTSISLSWSASTDNFAVTSYRIYRNNVQVGTSTTTSFTNSGLAPGTSYSYQVAAVDVAGNVSAKSTAVSFSTLPDTTPPSVPTGLVSPSRTVTSITLNWNPSTDDVAVTNYRIFRNGAQVGTSTTTGFTDSGLTPNTSYSYRIAAADASDNLSAQSTASSFSTAPDTSAPSVPAGLNSPSQTFTSVTLQWNTSSDNVGVTGYKIFRNGAQITSTATTSHTDNTVTAGNTYSYRVSAHDAAGNNSAQSTALSVTVHKRGDINRDGRINVFDLSNLLTNWLRTGPNAADLNGDSVVNIFDLSILLAGWTG